MSASVRLRRFCAVVMLFYASELVSDARGQTPDQAGFDHLPVVVMMENRSFDHFFGWLPGANAQQTGLSYTTKLAISHPTHALGPDYQGCGFLDPGHSYSDGRLHMITALATDFFSTVRTQIPRMASRIKLTMCSRSVTTPKAIFLSSAPPGLPSPSAIGLLRDHGGDLPNRFYMHAAQADRLINTSTTSTLPTIWDRLQEKGLSGRYYFNDLHFLGLWGSRYASISKPFSQFLTDAPNGTLPNVAYVDPSFEDESSGTSQDDHPHADIRNGEAFLNQIYDAVRNSPNWSKTVLIINYDEWGGFFDQVPPPTAPIPAATLAAGDTDGRLGFRVPCVVISLYARRNFVAHGQYDHTSLLKMVEWRFGLPPLTVRDETANNLAEVLNLTSPNLTTSAFYVPSGPFGAPCLPAPVPAKRSEVLRNLKRKAIKSGFQGVR